MILIVAVCAVSIGWAIRELLWVRRMRHRLEAIERGDLSELKRWTGDQ